MAFAHAASTLIKTALVSLETQFLETVAKDYNLPIEELREKYKITAEATSLKRPYKRKATVETVDQDGNKIQTKKAKDEDRPVCKGTTAKREPCKFHALKGCDFCKRHQEAFELEEARRSGKQIITTNKLTVAAEGELLHTHKPDDIMHTECNMCQTYGPVLGQFKPVEVKPLSTEEVQNRLNTIIQTAQKETLKPEEFSESLIEADDDAPSDTEHSSPEYDD